MFINPRRRNIHCSFTYRYPALALAAIAIYDGGWHGEVLVKSVASDIFMNSNQTCSFSRFVVEKREYYFQGQQQPRCFLLLDTNLLSDAAGAACDLHHFLNEARVLGRVWYRRATCSTSRMCLFTSSRSCS